MGSPRRRLLCLVALAAVGCSSSNNNTAKDAATETGSQSLYDKYGGAPTVKKVVDDAVTGLLADCQVAPYLASVGTPNHDSVDRLKGCLRLQFTALMGGPAKYPGKSDNGEMCVDMKTIHTGLQIPGTVFDKFVMDLGGVLKTDGVSDDDIATIAGAVAGTKTDIVSPSPVDKTACDAGVADSSTDATQSLFDKYGGAPTVKKVVDDAVTGLLADCQVAPYLASVGTPNHDSVDRLKSCLRLQFTALMGGPATYPGTNDSGETCVDMKTIHTGLQIPGTVFDKFVMDLGGVLKTDGVSDDDIAIIAGAVAGTKTDIVSLSPVDKTACDAGTGG
jgi:truncated hemoglobin YjbI